MTHTIRLHRVFAASPEKLFRAFTDADALARWLPPDGFTAHVDEFDARVGGGYRMRFTNFTTGASHAFSAEFRELAPGRVVHVDRFDAPGPPGEMVVTVDLAAVPSGTEATIVQAGVPEAIPRDACHLGWQQSLAHLARLVEPEIPD